MAPILLIILAVEVAITVVNVIGAQTITNFVRYSPPCDSYADS